MTSGPVVCMAWEGVGVVASAQKLIGSTNPLQPEPGTIRGDLAVQTGRNIIHGSDIPENGKREIGCKRKHEMDPEEYLQKCSNMKCQRVQVDGSFVPAIQDESMKLHICLQSLEVIMFQWMACYMI